MITGYNTDVRYGELVLHVQTEDKGKGNPCLESLIYYGGQVVAAKRASYADLLERGKGRDDIVTLMDYQHRTMIKAIQTGKFDDKIRSFVGDKLKTGTQAELPRETRTSAFEAAEETGRTLDQVILEYLTNEAEQEQLVLVMEEQVQPRAGSSIELVLRTRSSKTGDPISGAKVNVRMISTFGGPRTLGSGDTDHEGALHLSIQIPAVDHGTAALIITAASGIGQAELKHLL